MTPQECALWYAEKFIGKPYSWGGDDPLKGFDCSGLIIEIMQAVGAVKRTSDYGARELYLKLPVEAMTGLPTPGGLAFYQPQGGGDVCHVEMTLDGLFQLGASGGGSKTLTLEDAVRQNAFIKVRRIGSNPGLRVAAYARIFGDNGYILPEILAKNL